MIPHWTIIQEVADCVGTRHSDIATTQKILRKPGRINLTHYCFYKPLFLSCHHINAMKPEAAPTLYPALSFNHHK